MDVSLAHQLKPHDTAPALEGNRITRNSSSLKEEVSDEQHGGFGVNLLYRVGMFVEIPHDAICATKPQKTATLLHGGLVPDTAERQVEIDIIHVRLQAL